MAIDTWLPSNVQSYWSDAANWSGGVPGANSVANIDDDIDEVVIDDAFVAKAILNSGAVDIEDATGDVTTAIVNQGLLTVGFFSLFSPTPQVESSTITVGEIVNRGAFFLFGDDTVTTDALFNTFTGGSTTLLGTPVPDGSLWLSGDSVFDVHSAAQTSTRAGILTGEIELEDAAVLQFDSGGFTAISALGALAIFGSQASVAIAGQTGVNSALDSLATVAGGLALEDGAAISTTGDLAVAASGGILLDVPAGTNEYGLGGSSLTVLGTLSNAGLIEMAVVSPNGSGPPLANDLVTADSFRQSSTGGLFLDGQAAAVQFNVYGLAQLGNAVGHVSGIVALADDALIAFGGGEITTIDAGAQLSITGADAFIANSFDESSNSALTGLHLIGDGELDLQDGATLATTGALANSGTIDISGSPGSASSLTIGAGMVNDGEVWVDDDATFWVKGPVNGTGSITVADGGTAELVGAGSSQTLAFQGAGEFILGRATRQSVTGFQSGDAIDFNNVFYNAHETQSVTVGVSDDFLDVFSPKGSIIASIDIGLNADVQPDKFELGADSTGHLVISWS